MGEDVCLPLLCAQKGLFFFLARWSEINGKKEKKKKKKDAKEMRLNS